MPRTCVRVSPYHTNMRSLAERARVLELVSDGLCDTAIARRLDVPRATVRSMRLSEVRLARPVRVAGGPADGSSFATTIMLSCSASTSAMAAFPRRAEPCVCAWRSTRRNRASSPRRARSSRARLSYELGGDDARRWRGDIRTLCLLVAPSASLSTARFWPYAHPRDRARAMAGATAAERAVRLPQRLYSLRRLLLPQPNRPLLLPDLRLSKSLRRHPPALHRRL